MGISEHTGMGACQPAGSLWASGKGPAFRPGSLECQNGKGVTPAR